MLSRYVYRATVKDFGKLTKLIEEKEPVLKNKIISKELLTLSIYKFEQSIIVYYEAMNDKTPIEQLLDFKEVLEPVNELDKTVYWSKMQDVFHYSRMENIEYWDRKTTPQQRRGSIARLKEEMVPSYIFHHYQLQEEKAEAVDKYGMIALSGNMIFMYNELPFLEVQLPYKPALQEAERSVSWLELMIPHFVLWDGKEPWMEMECLLSV